MREPRPWLWQQIHRWHHSENRTKMMLLPRIRWHKGSRELWRRYAREQKLASPMVRACQIVHEILPTLLACRLHRRSKLQSTRLLYWLIKQPARIELLLPFLRGRLFTVGILYAGKVEILDDVSFGTLFQWMVSILKNKQRSVNVAFAPLFQNLFLSPSVSMWPRLHLDLFSYAVETVDLTHSSSNPKSKTYMSRPTIPRLVTKRVFHKHPSNHPPHAWDQTIFRVHRLRHRIDNRTYAILLRSARASLNRTSALPGGRINSREANVHQKKPQHTCQ